MLLTELCIDEREEGSLHFAPSLNQYPVHATLANLYTLFSFFFFLFVFLIKFLKKKAWIEKLHKVLSRCVIDGL